MIITDSNYKYWIKSLKTKFRESQLKAAIKVNSTLLSFYRDLGQDVVEGQQLVTQIPWGQNIVVLTKCKTIDEALYYAKNTMDNGWSRSVLTHQIEGRLWERQGKAIIKVESDLAKQRLKDPYDFEPEFAGKLNFYLNAVDGELKQENDNPTIGLLLCKGKDNMLVEYALKNIDSPMGASEYQITESLPKEFQFALPTVEDIEAGIGRGGVL